MVSVDRRSRYAIGGFLKKTLGKKKFGNCGP